MAMHPAEIAKEIGAYDFFQSFDQPLLLNVATLIRQKSFNAGEFILRQGQVNDCLYFIRKGKVDILVDEDRVIELSKTGEVLGEISVVHAKPASANVKASTAVDCFMLSSADFEFVAPEHKDRFMFLLYKIYSLVVSERLSKTNEKAKKFEKMSKELEQAKQEIQIITSAQLNFLSKSIETSLTPRTALLIEPNKKQQNIAKTALSGTGVDLRFASDAVEAQELLKTKKFDVVLCDSSLGEVTKLASSPDRVILMAPLRIELKDIQANPQVLNLMSRDPEDRVLTTKMLLTSLSKILNRDIFGIEKYLNWGIDVVEQRIYSSKDREALRMHVLEYFRGIGIRSSTLDRCQVCIEELLMNAIYAAPTNEKGEHLYNHLPRTTEISLTERQAPLVRYGCDGVFLGFSIRDPFGSLSKPILLEYLDKNYSGDIDPHNPDKGGAGRGLHQIIESADLTIFNVKMKQTTEVICLWNIESATQRKAVQSSFHFFFH